MAIVFSAMLLMKARWRYGWRWAVLIALMVLGVGLVFR
jgi:hypothetical protein